jgi:hypothetical protein
VGHDARRDAWLAEQSVWVLRVGARDVLAEDTRAAVLDMIAAINHAAEWAPPPHFARSPSPAKTRGRIRRINEVSQSSLRVGEVAAPALGTHAFNLKSIKVFLYSRCVGGVIAAGGALRDGLCRAWTAPLPSMCRRAMS